MATKFVMLPLFLALTILSCQVSARRLAEDAALRKLTFAYLVTTDADLGTRSPRLSENFEAVVQEQANVGSHSSIEYENLEEIDRLKLSINKLICDTMDEGCDHMDDAADHSDTTDLTHESFAALNPHDHVREIEY